MATYNTGNASATALTIDKQAGGASIIGYPKTYSLLSSFGAYTPISAVAWASYSEAQREERRSAFTSYVNGEEGVSVAQIQTNSPTKTDVEMCPINTPVG